MTPYHPPEHEVLLRRRGPLGEIVLNRPKALNALTHDMVRSIRSALDAWADDDDVHAVVVSGAGERGFCAGGDIVAIYHDARAGGAGAAAAFWRDEYALNAAIAAYPKPYVAIMDGVVLGGGVGLSAHGSHRIVTERSSVGMPETTIGFAPDVGGTYLLSRAPGELGTHLALTAGRMSPGEAVALGFADSYVPSSRIPHLRERLTETAVDHAIDEVAEAVPPAALLAHRSWIDPCYAGDDVEAIVARLAERAGRSSDIREAAAVIARQSPTSLKVTLASLRRAARQSSLNEVLDQEFGVSVRMLATRDLVEGIRAQVVEKDRAPAWSPERLDQVSAAAVEAFFSVLGPDEPRPLRLGQR